MSSFAQQRQTGRLLSCIEVRAGCSEWEVEVGGGRARAVAYPELTGPLRPGDEVLLNTTAVALGLGTGGVHFVICRAGEEAGGSFPGREAGHILKLRYTPAQLRVLCAEEEASPHRAAVEGFTGLHEMPVLAAELHSQAAAAAIVLRSLLPGKRLVWLQLDSAALPLAFSRLAARLREDGIVDATVTAGQCFGGDYEAVNVYSGLVTGKEVAGADAVLVTQGPGNAGTGTRYGFSGMALLEALHACDTLGGLGVLVPRLSGADARPRHRGLSHHTRTLLACLRAPVAMPLPEEAADLIPALEEETAGAGHAFPVWDPSLDALEAYREVLTTMGRTLDEDPLFFRGAAAAAGWVGAREEGKR